MIDAVDTHINARLGKRLFEGNPITVYPYLPSREHGETVYPCKAWTRRTVEPDRTKARPNCEVFIPSETEIEIDVQQNMGGGTLTGPESYTEKPYPIPVHIVYEIHVLATTEAHSESLTEGLIQLFPPGYMPTIDGQTPYFELGEPLDLDELEAPVFRKGFILSVSDVWVDAIDSWARKPITQIDFDTEA